MSIQRTLHAGGESRRVVRTQKLAGDRIEVILAPRQPGQSRDRLVMSLAEYQAAVTKTLR